MNSFLTLKMALYRHTQFCDWLFQTNKKLFFTACLRDLLVSKLVRFNINLFFSVTLTHNITRDRIKRICVKKDNVRGQKTLKTRGILTLQKWFNHNWLNILECWSEILTQNILQNLTMNNELTIMGKSQTNFRIKPNDRHNGGCN